MADISILLAGGMKQDKAEKVVQALQKALKERKIDAKIDAINLFEVTDLSGYEMDHDVVINVSTKNLNTSLPTIQGLGLMYPWMGTDELYKKISEMAG
ncbi:MAG: hypothetical protein LIO81_02255 [Clostridiales bacterium]|nr:hypothetical protein [Clostridiales bacterium]